MRASTVFILALVLLVGFVALAVAKAAGLFNPSPPPPPAPERPPIKALFSKTNLFEKITITADQVYVRDLTAAEEAALKSRFGDNWQSKLLPPLVTAAHLRTPRQNIVADQPLFRDQFEDINLPEPISLQLEPNTRAVNVKVDKDKAVGGVLRVGEYVDVFLTAKVGIGNEEELRTACIARGCKIVMKRNVMWTMMAGDPDDKPLHFTLQANPYRAALIAYAQQNGQISLLPGSPPLRIGSSWSDPSSPEYAMEDQRIDEINRGTRVVGAEDLVRIFQIPPAPLPTPPPLRIQHLAGVSEAGYTYFYPTNGNGRSQQTGPQQPVQPAGGPQSRNSPRANGSPASQPVNYTFRLPNASDTECKTCGKDKKPDYPVIRN
jgi:Flp pilus assembly protein CpaB